ncbi:MAG: hypothetical protein HZA03_09920 [Nitrospinae bacterium]|nr:hypothetical protein [Nitrospinota bacterium]
METENKPEFNIIIEFDDFLTRFDLEEILSSIDGIIEDELLSNFDSDFPLMRRHNYRHPPWYQEAPGLSYIGITAVNRGSIILSVIFSSAVSTYVAHRFKIGIDKSLLAKDIERSGKLIGDKLGSILKRINDWVEEYVPEQRELGGKVKKIRVEKKRKRKND